jgi:hypothetical protein
MSKVTPIRSSRVYPLIALQEIAEEPDEGKRREACLTYLVRVWDAAEARTYMTKHGDEVTAPDLQIMRDVALALPELMGVSAPSSARKLPSLAVFGGGKKG